MIKLYLQKLRINKGGYDDHGVYYGVGRPVYTYYSDNEPITGEVRAIDREDAKCLIEEKYPNKEFSFYR